MLRRRRPSLRRRRLSLRRLELEDDHEILFLRSDERVLQYLSIPKSNTLEDARAFIEKIQASIAADESVYWAISSRENNKLIGTICLWNIVPKEKKAEIGYVLHPDWQGRGLMQEAVQAVLAYSFETLHLHLVEAYLHRDNKSSVALLKRTGFVFETMEKDMLIYSQKKPARSSSHRK